MKVVCTQSTLNTNLSLVSRAVPSRPTHPVLVNVLLVADKEKGQLDLTAFDLSLGICTSFSATVIESGPLALPAKLLNDIVSRLPESAEITISDEPDPEALEDERATLTTGAGRFKINQEKNVDEYPELPAVEAGQSLVLPVSALTDGLKGVLFAASTDETKQVLTGVHLTRTEAGLEFAATDSHRLAVVQTAASEVEEKSVETESNNGDGSVQSANSSDTGGGEDFEVTIPARALRELKQMLGSMKESPSIQLKVDEGQVVFDLDTRRLTSLKLEGQYPDYRRLIPQEFSRQISLDRKELLKGLELVAVLADQKNNTVKFSLDRDKQELNLSVETQDVGSAKQSMSAQIVGESIEIAFNIKYLMDGLKAIPGHEIKMELNEGDRPVIFTPLGGIKMTYLVMPVQMRD